MPSFLNIHGRSALFCVETKKERKGHREGRAGRRKEKGNCSWDIELIYLFIKEKQNIGEEKTYRHTETPRYISRASGQITG